MTKIDIFSGFLGAGKTTLIKKLIQEAYKGEKLVLIENEFGEIGIDGGFLQDAGVEITEMNSGCICCSLVGDFGQALEQVLTQFHPDRILIEPSGVGKLSDVIGAVQRLNNHDIQLNAFVTVADATKCKIYMKNFGEFFNNQIEHAAAIVLSRTDGMSEKKLMDTVALLREHNANAPIITITMRTMTMMDMSMNTSIITMTTMSMNMSITTIMTMTNMNTTIITTVVAPAAMTMMPTMSSSAGALRRPVSTRKRRSTRLCLVWTTPNSVASSCGRRASCPAPMGPGSISTMCQGSRMSAVVLPASPAVCA